MLIVGGGGTRARSGQHIVSLFLFCNKSTAQSSRPEKKAKMNCSKYGSHHQSGDHHGKGSALIVCMCVLQLQKLLNCRSNRDRQAFSEARAPASVGTSPTELAHSLPFSLYTLALLPRNQSACASRTCNSSQPSRIAHVSGVALVHIDWQ